MTIPDGPGAGRGDADGPQRRRRHRADAQRQELPGHRTGRRRRGRLGRGQLLQRGPARRTRCTCTSSRSSSTPRTASRSTQPYFADTINIAPGERYSVLFHADRPRHLGLALPHPHPRRVGGRHVRHGDRDRGQPGDLSVTHPERT